MWEWGDRSLEGQHPSTGGGAPQEEGHEGRAVGVGAAGADLGDSLPEDKVSAVDLPPTVAVLQDASIAHHCTLLKLGPVVGHVLRGDRSTALRVELAWAFICCSHLWTHKTALQEV